MTPRVLQAPLPWQCMLLCWAAGLLGASWPCPSLLFLALLLAADDRLRPSAPWTSECLRRGGARLVCCLLLWCAGWGAASVLLRPPSPPSWLPGVTDMREPPRFRAVRVCGTVEDAQGLPDNRLRVLLREVRPESGEGRPLEDLVAWTWEQPLFRPLPGQRVCLARSLRPVRGFADEEPAFDPLEVGGETQPPRGFELWWRARGVAWTLWSRGNAGNPLPAEGTPSLAARWREAWYQAFLAALRLDEVPAGQGRALLPALIFGEREYVASSVFRQVAAASLAHSLALSGQHLAIAGLLGALAVRLAALACPACCLRRPFRVWVLICSLPFALAYLWIGNAPPSLVRAACMLLVVSLAMSFRREEERSFLWAALAPRSGWDALCLAVLGMTVVSPLSVYDTGLQLSVLCVGALCALPPLLARIVPSPAGEARRTGRDRLRALLRAAVGILVVSLALQIALLPLNVLLFASPGHWFWLNVLWLPVLGCVVMPLAFLGLLCAVCGWQFAAEQVLSLAAVPCDALLELLQGLADAGLLESPALLRPHWTALMAIPLLFLVGMIAVGRERLPGAARRLAVAAVLLLCAGPWMRFRDACEALRREEVRLDVLDVGQGQAVLLTLPDGERWLIDGGGSLSPRFDPGEALVLPAIAANRKPELAAVINSHPDLDHAGGLPVLLARVPPSVLLHNGREGRKSVGERWRQAREPWERTGRARVLSAGDVLTLGDAALGLRLEVLWPPKDAAGLSPNDASLILRLTRRGQGLALLPGDAEKPALREVLRSGRDLSSEVLLLPHHGSSGSFLAGLYRAVRPRLVLASCGFGNRYGYPARGIRRWFAERRVPLLDTARWGRLQVLWQADEAARIRSARPGPHDGRFPPP
ncbi:MAG: ComEC/Rec2 family competence protein [Desulfovibrio sp.]|uniref:ComEC/Rec2 family competence protein n=1 Tax=Desulfovibrio sp. TaxID=885 RepID=UPI0025BA50BF|nr:ComEC/Rec2 family competence protein [Desulfovibrio sp.]MCI7569165.1 ComEC/Rec2 family competence protein [Desulfovibrio sp.]